MYVRADVETWQWPGINLFLPDMAQSLLLYRVNRLPGAERNAAERNQSGARFPWESAFTGEETAPYTPCGDRELHVNGDIAVAVWHYWRAFKDVSAGWLETTAWPLLSGIATWWMSKLAQDNAGAPAGAPLSILDVMCPDEYADHVNNSAYTNAVTHFTLTYAAAVGELLNKPAGVLAEWRDAAARISRPTNAALNFTPEYDGYRPGQTIKQADVILMGFPLDAPWLDAAQRARDLQYYATVTDGGGPAMTWGMFAVGLISLGAGFEAAAASNFNRSYANAQPPFLVWTETPTGGTPNFLTGAGGFLQTAYFGYSGLRIGDDNMTIAPSATAPELTSVIRLRGVSYLGCRVNIAIDFAAATLSVGVQVPMNAAEAAAVDAAGVPVATADAPGALLRGHGAGSGGGGGSGRGGAHRHSLAPREPLSRRSQRGRVLVGGQVVAARVLELVDAAGVTHALTPGEPVSLPLPQVVTVREVA